MYGRTASVVCYVSPLPRKRAFPCVQVLAQFHSLVVGGTYSNWTLEAVNHEGWRVNVDEGNGRRGWALLRQVGRAGDSMGHVLIHGCVKEDQPKTVRCYVCMCARVRVYETRTTKP